MENVEIKKLEKELDALDKKIAKGDFAYEDFDNIKKRRREIIARLEELGFRIIDDMVHTLAPRE